MRAFEAVDSKRPCFFGSSPGHDQSRHPHAIKWVRAWTGRVKTQIHLGQSDGFHRRCSWVGDVSTLEPSGVNDKLEILVKNVPVSLVLPSVSSVFSFSLHRRLITAGRPLILVCYWFVFFVCSELRVVQRFDSVALGRTGGSGHRAHVAFFNCGTFLRTPAGMWQ